MSILFQRFILFVKDFIVLSFQVGIRTTVLSVIFINHKIHKFNSLLTLFPCLKKRGVGKLTTLFQRGLYYYNTVLLFQVETVGLLLLTSIYKSQNPVNSTLFFFPSCLKKWVGKNVYAFFRYLLLWYYFFRWGQLIFYHPYF